MDKLAQRPTGREGVSGVYAPPLVAALSGTTIRQLRYWRETDLLSPEHWGRKEVLYSYVDLVALRTFGYLREAYTLQQIRRAIHTLRGLGNLNHLASYQVVGSGGTIVLVHGDMATDLLRRPGQGLIAQMVDVFGPFVSLRGSEIVPLNKPYRGVEIDGEVRGGYPVVEGTRVPFDLVAELVRDGVAPQDVRNFYPSVSATSAAAAVKLAEYVREYTHTTAA